MCACLFFSWKSCHFSSGWHPAGVAAPADWHAHAQKCKFCFAHFAQQRENTHTHTRSSDYSTSPCRRMSMRVCVWVGRWHSICVTLGAAGCIFSSPFSTSQREMAGRTSKGKMVDPGLTQNRHGGNSRTIKGWDGSLYVRSLSFFHLPSPSSFLQCQISQMLCVRAFPLLPEMVMENGKGCASADGSCVAGDLDAYQHTCFSSFLSHAS